MSIVSAYVVFLSRAVKHPFCLGELKALIGVLTEQPVDHLKQRTGASRRIEFALDYGGQAGEGPVPLEGRPSFDGGVQRCTQGPQVRGGSTAAAQSTLGRGVGRRTEQHPRDGQGRAVVGLGDPEVGQDHPVLRAEQDVRGLNITMDDTGLVRGPQASQHTQAHAGRLGGGQGTVLGDDLAQRTERHEFHHDRRTVVFLDDVVDGHDVRMAQPRGHLRFPHGTVACGLAFRRAHLRRPDDFLNRHIPVEQFIARPPDSAHPALTDNRAKPVAPGQQAIWLASSHFRRLPCHSGS